MAYATMDNYTEWLRGRVSTVPPTEFPFWASRASSEIDLATFNRLHDAETLAEYEAAVIATTCELAEIIFNNESPDGKKELTGYSVDGYSENYVNPKDAQSRITTALRRGLALTGLLSRAV